MNPFGTFGRPVWCVLVLLGLGLLNEAVGATSREGQLRALRLAFPSHLAGPVTEATDPLVRECYLGFKAIVDRLELATLPEDVGRLRAKLEREIGRHRRLYERAKTKDLEVRTASMRRAIELNLAWLTQKMRPFVARLETFQRGRGL